MRGIGGTFDNNIGFATVNGKHMVAKLRTKVHVSNFGGLTVEVKFVSVKRVDNFISVLFRIHTSK